MKSTNFPCFASIYFFFLPFIWVPTTLYLKVEPTLFSKYFLREGREWEGSWKYIGMIIFYLVFIKKLIKLNFFKKLKLVQTDQFRFGFFKKTCSNRFDLVFFIWVRFDFFSFKFIKPNRSVLKKNLIYFFYNLIFYYYFIDFLVFFL